MRSQHYTIVAIPIPINLPPQVVVAFIQTYVPTLRLNDHVAGFEEIPADPSCIANDPFFGPWDDTVRSFQVHEITRLLPGVSRETRWPVVFQSFPDGISSRANANAGILVWARWTVRRRDVASPASPASPETATSSPATEVGEEWELYEEVLTDANTMLMRFTARSVDRIHNQITQRLVDEVCKSYFDGTLYQ
ncbi:hypothetical protein G7Z17_g2116 [Cylindrodendrum hubeiense]|uniref:DUF7053 domain-containing protein n=1 Tax=Cylindrodendrum hubeiense TaxID=595255 RepID=A0A9P5LER5_9HYPO|nr:hypothetical protein G7Z17_g2116 [Cylindrodendrum hubeiense]